MKGKTEKILCGFSSIFPKYLENMHARCVREDTKQALKGNLQADGVQSRQTLLCGITLKATLWVLPKEKEETFMKLVTYLQNGIEQIGVLTPAEDAVVPAGMLGLDFCRYGRTGSADDRCPAGHGSGPAAGKKPERESSGTGEAAGTNSPTGTGHHLSGRNFSEHAKESVGVMGQEYGGERKFPDLFRQACQRGGRPGTASTDTLTLSPIWTTKWKWHSSCGKTFRVPGRRTRLPMCSATPL